MNIATANTRQTTSTLSTVVVMLGMLAAKVVRSYNEARAARREVKALRREDQAKARQAREQLNAFWRGDTFQGHM